ncbi:MAG: hypothetical protein LBD68_09625 [Zoogloeaceae bacterium]|jgi:hypothetical protein|nr:hypothetical protein [Zoogloeaceae bacterium]
MGNAIRALRRSVKSLARPGLAALPADSCGGFADYRLAPAYIRHCLEALRQLRGGALVSIPREESRRQTPYSDRRS